MASYDNAYSRWVVSLKIILPLAALVLLSTLFLFSRQVDPDRAIPFAQVDVEEIAREQRITGAAYSGVTQDGTSFAISAATARPDLEDSRRMFAEDLRAELNVPSGETVVITSGAGVIDTGAEMAALSDGVRVDTNTGYRFESTALKARLDASSVVSDDPVRVEMPLGILDAGAMNVERTGGPNGPMVLHFTDQVKLLYTPPG